jgi:deoxyribose-phosphate aldolase
VVRAARDRQGITVKVILETALLTNDEKLVACRLAEEAGADFVKTSTGFAAAGATTTDVALMRRAVGDRLGVKAAGGIKSISTALAMIAAGATRLGTSSSVSIMKEFDDGVPSSVARDGGVKR